MTNHVTVLEVNSYQIMTITWNVTVHKKTAELNTEQLEAIGQILDMLLKTNIMILKP